MVANAVITQLTRVPQLTSRTTTFSTPRISENRSVKLPSNRITATQSETSGKSRSPNNSSGFNQSVRGPAANPAVRRNTIAGNFSRQPSHWQRMASPPIAAICTAMSLSSGLSLFSSGFSGLVSCVPDVSH